MYVSHSLYAAAKSERWKAFYCLCITVADPLILIHTNVKNSNNKSSKKTRCGLSPKEEKKQNTEWLFSASSPPRVFPSSTPHVEICDAIFHPSVPSNGWQHKMEKRMQKNNNWKRLIPLVNSKHQLDNRYWITSELWCTAFFFCVFSSEQCKPINWNECDETRKGTGGGGVGEEWEIHFHHIFYSMLNKQRRKRNSIRWPGIWASWCRVWCARAGIVHSTWLWMGKVLAVQIIMYNQNLWFVWITLRILFGYRYRRKSTAAAVVCYYSSSPFRLSVWYNLCEYALCIEICSDFLTRSNVKQK